VDIGVDVQRGDLPSGAGQGGQQGGVVAGAGADLHDALAWLHVEGVEHGGDDERVRGAAQVSAVGEGVGNDGLLVVGLGE
jgi:hypothetical protein